MVNLVVVFDLDQTIGFFEQIGILMESIEKIIKRDLKQKEIFTLFDLFPECFRKGIMKTFQYLVQKKKTQKIKVIIYTNNIGPKSWVYTIKKYIEKKLNYQLFDRTIAAWKVGSLVYEKLRTSHNKRYDDLLQCAKLQKTDKIIFFDDFVHYHLKHPNVTYINNKPYIKDYSFVKMINKLFKSELKPLFKNINKKILLDVITSMINRYNYRIKKKSKITENEFLNEIKVFLKNNKKNYTRKKFKKQLKRKNKTYKTYKNL